MKNFRLIHPVAPSSGDRPAATLRLETTSSGRVALLVGETAVVCGVADFARGLADTLDKRGTRTENIDLSDPSQPLRDLWKCISQAHATIANVPLVAWKRLPFKPLLAIALSRIAGRKTIVVLHEWAGLHRLRRLVLRPLIAMATDIVVLSPTIRRELSADRWIGWAARKASFAPLPPNIEPSGHRTETPFSRQLKDARRAGRPIVGVFGSIYPGKLPLAALSVAEELKRRGENPLIAFIGHFIRASDNIEQIFWREVRARDLADNVAVSGFVASEAELFGIFEKIDAFVYRFAEGMTARRSSVLAAVQSGRPVIVTAPADNDEFSHHAKLSNIIARGALVFIPRDASDAAYADAIVAAIAKEDRENPIVAAAWWDDLAASIERVLRGQ